MSYHNPSIGYFSKEAEYDKFPDFIFYFLSRYILLLSIVKTPLRV